MNFYQISRAQLTVFISLLGRVVLSIGGIVIIKIGMGTVGVEGYASYALIVALLPWILLLDAGFGSSLQNHLIESKLSIQAKTDLIVTYFACSFLLGAGLFLLVYGFRELLIQWFFSKEISNNSEMLMYQKTFLLGIVCLIIQAWGSIGSKCFFGREKAWLINGLNALGVLITILLMLLFKNVFASGNILVDLPLFTFCCQICPTLLGVSYLVVILRWALIAGGRVDFQTIKLYENRRKSFFRFSLLATCILNFEALIYAKVLSRSELAMYVILLRVFGGGFSFFASTVVSIWPELTKIYDKKEYLELKNYIRRILFWGFLAIFIITVIFLFGKDEIFRWFSKSNELILPPTILILAFSSYYFIRIWTDTFSLLLQSSSNMKILNRAVILQAILAVIFQISLGNIFGAIGLVTGSVVAFLLSVAWILPKEVFAHIKHVAST